MLLRRKTKGNTTQRAKFAKKVHKLPLRVDAINFELHQYGSLGVPQTLRFTLRFLDLFVEVSQVCGRETKSKTAETHHMLLVKFSPFIFWYVDMSFFPSYNHTILQSGKKVNVLSFKAHNFNVGVASCSLAEKFSMI